MPRSTQKTVFLICSFIGCCAAIILASVAYATRYWVTQTYTTNSTAQADVEFELNAGLFALEGYNPIFGPISESMKDCYNKYNAFMNFGLWLSTILFIALGMLFGVVAAVFAAVNSAITPIEEITGVTGLYLWNGLASLFSLIAVLLWVAQYCSYLVDIMWSMKFVEEGKFIPVETHEPSELGYSFYLMCGVAFLYLVNNGLVYLSTANLDKSKGQIIDEPMSPDGMIMLY